MRSELDLVGQTRNHLLLLTGSYHSTELFHLLNLQGSEMLLLSLRLMLRCLQIQNYRHPVTLHTTASVLPKGVFDLNFITKHLQK